jgi:hypothetical protein
MCTPCVKASSSNKRRSEQVNTVGPLHTCVLEVCRSNLGPGTDDPEVFCNFILHDMIYLSTAIGLTPDGSTHLHNNNRTTQITINLEECGPCPFFASFTLVFAVQLRKKQGKTSVMVAEEFLRLLQATGEIMPDYATTASSSTLSKSSTSHQSTYHLHVRHPLVLYNAFNHHQHNHLFVFLLNRVTGLHVSTTR